MKKNFNRIFLALTLVVLSSLVAIAATPTAPKVNKPSAQEIVLAKKQVAVQLGAIKMGLIKPGQSAKSLNPAQLAAALADGTLALNTPDRVSPALLQQATLAALQSPVVAPLLGLDNTKITPAAIVAAAIQVNPSVAAGAFATVLAKAAVGASMAFTVDNHGVNRPLFGPQPDTSTLPPNPDKATLQAFNTDTKSAQLQAAAAAEGVVLTAALQGIDPNIKPGSTVTISPKDPNYEKIVSTIAAISSASINGLGNFNLGKEPDPLYGKTIPNVKALTINLVATSESLVNLTGGPNGANPVVQAVTKGLTEAAPGVSIPIGTQNNNNQQNNTSPGTPGGNGAGGNASGGTFGIGNNGGGGGTPTPTPTPTPKPTPTPTPPPVTDNKGS